MNQPSSPNHFPATLPADLRAGLVTFLVALPLCMGIALASGAPPLAGLIAGIVGGVVVGALSGSRLSVSGPAAGLTTIVAAGILQLQTYEAFLAAVVLAGVLQVGLGYARAGGVASYFPVAVIKGMLAAIGLTLLLKQLPQAVGLDGAQGVIFQFRPASAAAFFVEIERVGRGLVAGAILTGALSISILLLWNLPVVQRRRGLGQVPGALAAVLAGLLLNEIFRQWAPQLALGAEHLVQLPRMGGGTGLRSLLRLPDFGAVFTHAQVLVAAVTIAAVASLETLLNVEAIDKIDPLRGRTPPNRELKAQGVGNIVSGLLGGLPVTSVIVRSSVNLAAGARSRYAAIIHGMLLLGCVLLIPGLLNRIPLAALASVLLVTGYKLTPPALYVEQWRRGQSQFLPFAVTVVAVLFTNLLIGTGIGLLVGVFFIVRANYRTAYLFQREHAPGITDKIRISLADHVSFLNKASLVERLYQLPEDSVVEIDARQSSYVDHDVLDAIEDFRSTARQRNIQLIFHPGQAGSRTDRHTTAPAALPMAAAQALANPTGGSAAHAGEPGAGSPLPPPDRTRYDQLFANNRRWVEQKLQLAPTYFEDMARGQSPQFLFIGCSDSRVTIDSMTGTGPGEIFVHRNIANLVVATDLNLLSVVQYAVAVLKVQHVIVLGHYGCGGVKAAMKRESLGLINKWLIPIRDVMRLHRAELAALPSEHERFRRLVELSIQEQVYNLCKTSFVQQAWAGQEHLHVHGWVYDIREGLMRDLEVNVAGMMAEDEDLYRLAPSKSA